MLINFRSFFFDADRDLACDKDTLIIHTHTHTQQHSSTAKYTNTHTHSYIKKRNENTLHSPSLPATTSPNCIADASL